MNVRTVIASIAFNIEKLNLLFFISFSVMGLTVSFSLFIGSMEIACKPKLSAK